MSAGLFEQLPLFGFFDHPGKGKKSAGRNNPVEAPGNGQDGERQPKERQPKKRHILLGPRIVSYTLALARHRRLAMTIDERGLRVAAPLSATIREVEGFIRQHAQWVVKKLDEHAGSRARRHVAVRDGVSLPLLGAEIALRITAGANRARWERETLVLEAQADADYELLVRRALQRRALTVFAERAALYARELDLELPPLRLSSARTRWGSCSLKTGIRINWRLIHLPLSLIDYVIVHELAHLVEMNHSARFWAVVGRAFPDWRQARRELKLRATDIPLL